MKTMKTPRIFKAEKKAFALIKSELFTYKECVNMLHSSTDLLDCEIEEIIEKMSNKWENIKKYS